ncbi:GTPase-activating protein [Lithospermum erythrorhizon]|uniref:GTPase-activating protein n=1 Tax=Lithospermum erythrorhizon TaxID=34254 RepID=A0AAV3NVD1_LITER
MKAKGVVVLSPHIVTFDHKRDAYGFPIKPQHVHRYREYANIYKEEEEERSDRWNDFLERQAEAGQLHINGLSSDVRSTKLQNETGTEGSDSSSKDDAETRKVTDEKSRTDDFDRNASEKVIIPPVPVTLTHRVLMWTEIRPSLHAIEDMMGVRVKKKSGTKEQSDTFMRKRLPSTEDARNLTRGYKEDSDDEFYELERTESDSPQYVSSTDSASGKAERISSVTGSFKSLSLYKEELESLVRGGVPMALRGELWQAFVGVRERRVEKYYHNLVASDTDFHNTGELKKDLEGNLEVNMDILSVPEKWKGQIEKDLPRTFPGHPVLDEDGRNALRRLLTAYARHNPSVGYCQAMNFFAGLLLLLMPEENAFWTLLGILDDYFDGYYSEEMIESQVDQLVLEELVREKFPKLVNHLDNLGVQVAWVSGPWFLSIFMNMLPWESVLRVWDVLLFEGNRVMLFRTALALMELYGPALVTTKDAGDAITLLQSLAGSTFDSSQLVLTASMGFQNVNESRLQELRSIHRPAVWAAVEERSKGLRVWKDSQGLASKLYNYKHDSGSILGKNKTNQVDRQSSDVSKSDSASANVDELYTSLAGSVETYPLPDLQEQGLWLKAELFKLVEENRSVELRAEELETALMEMVKQDNGRQLSGRVKQLEQEVADLRQALAGKQEQENAIIQVLMRVEQEQKVTEDARRFAEQDAASQRIAAQVLQEKYEQTMASVAKMEKRVVMVESMLEATLQYQSGQNKMQSSDSSPQTTQQNFSPGQSIQDIPSRKISLLSRPFGLGWLDKNKGKAAEDDTHQGKHHGEAFTGTESQ